MVKFAGFKCNENSSLVLNQEEKFPLLAHEGDRKDRDLEDHDSETKLWVSAISGPGSSAFWF